MMLEYNDINRASYSTNNKLFQRDVIKWIRKNIINLYQSLISKITNSINFKNHILK